MGERKKEKKWQMNTKLLINSHVIMFTWHFPVYKVYTFVLMTIVEGKIGKATLCNHEPWGEMDLMNSNEEIVGHKFIGTFHRVTNVNNCDWLLCFF